MAAVAPPPTTLPSGPNVAANTSRPASSNSSNPASRKGSMEPRAVAPPADAEARETVKSEDAKSPKADPSRPSSENDNPQRPPARPHAAVRSKFELEPNPFDLSFSKSSHRSNSSTSDRTTPPRGTDATAIKHNALPPLSSLTSPAAADPSQFPWLASQSLRTGPLSPAMLAGPANANAAQGNGTNGNRPAQPAEGAPAEGGFDTTAFRTGFTPGTGSGFTPGYSSLMNGNFASSLPMPSPNTAAFLNMVTNSTPLEGGADPNAQTQQSAVPGGDTQPLHPPSAIPPHMQPHHGLSHLQHGQAHGEVPQDTITPGTLSALTGVFNDMSRQQVNGAPHAPQFFQPGLQQHPSNVAVPHGIHPPHLPHGVDYAQQSANAASQAANGLFLLSQAHQELSKREEEGRPGVPAGGTPLMNKKGGGNAIPPRPPVQQHSTQGTKRKSDAGAGMGAGATKPPKKGRKASTAAAKMESASPDFDMDTDDEDKEERGGKPETEEEKRKNFLERNRQAALKCRQRKKQWLQELQQKVEQLTMENERLQQTIGGLHDEVGRLSTILMQHRDCGLGMPAGYGRPIR